MKLSHNQHLREAKQVECNVCGKPFQAKEDMEMYFIFKHNKEILLMKQLDKQSKIDQQKCNKYNNILHLTK